MNIRLFRYCLSINRARLAVSIAMRCAAQKTFAYMWQPEANNLACGNKPGFFDKLPTASGVAAAVRSLRAEPLPDTLLNWQVRLVHPTRATPYFKMRLDPVYSGTQAGQPWVGNSQTGGRALHFLHYRRIAGVFDLPGFAVAKTITATAIKRIAVRLVQAKGSNRGRKKPVRIPCSFRKFFQEEDVYV